MVRSGDDITVVVTSQGEVYPGSSVVLAAGWQNPRLATELRTVVRVVGESTMYVTPGDAHRFSPDRFPIVGHYAFPADRHGMVHVSPGGAPEFEIEVDPSDSIKLDRLLPDPVFVGSTREVMETWVPELALAPVTRLGRCFYPVTSHDDYLLYRRGNVVTLVGCASGTGFKTAPIVAAIGTELAAGGAGGSVSELYSQSFTYETALRAR
jgi:glycine/D-amino acid oxidase-like deaminating enzyme